MSLIQKIKNYIVGDSEKQPKDIINGANKLFTRRFYKENGLWYIDLPEFLEGGFGKKNDLLMVDGSDTLLDILSNYTHEVVIQFSNFWNTSLGHADAYMEITPESFERHNPHKTKNQALLDAVGHAKVDYGAYYEVRIKGNNKPFRAWLCPVAEWVFGEYPKSIYVKIIK